MVFLFTEDDGIGGYVAKKFDLMLICGRRTKVDLSERISSPLFGSLLVLGCEQPMRCWVGAGEDCDVGDGRAKGFVSYMVSWNDMLKRM